MPATKMMHIRVDETLRDQAVATFSAMGLDMSAAIRLYLQRVVTDEAIPFEIKVPNALTRAAIEEARRMGRAQFNDAESLFDHLDGQPPTAQKRKTRRVAEVV